MKLGSLCGLASPPARAVRIRVFVLTLCALLSVNTLAFNSSLQPEEVREAYSLGQRTNHKELADFFNQYTHNIQYPSDKPVVYVLSVEFQTPYEQIVLRTLRNTRYSKFQADEDYQVNQGLVIVRFVISLRTNFGGPMPPTDTFKVVVSQTKPIEPEKMTSTVICDPYYNSYEYPVNSDCSPYLREILLRFDAEQFAPGAATINVETPDGQTIQTKYNLDKLK
jgi:hypothetical protein